MDRFLKSGVLFMEHTSYRSCGDSSVASVSPTKRIPSN